MENKKKRALEQPLIDEFSHYKRQKTHKDSDNKRADHKHDYSVETVLIKGFSHIDLISHGHTCSICGKQHDQRYVWKEHIDQTKDETTGICRVSGVGLMQLKKLFPGAVIIYEGNK